MRMILIRRVEWSANYKASEWPLAAEATVDFWLILRRGLKPRAFKADRFHSEIRSLRDSIELPSHDAAGGEYWRCDAVVPL
jgi:hypothetical protein